MRALLAGLVLVASGRAASAAPSPAPEKGAVHIEIFKKARELRLYRGDFLIREFPVGLGLDPVTAKARQGDHATPERHYRVCSKNPNSRFYLSLALSYPNREDGKRGVKDGLITARQEQAIAQALNAGRCPPWNTALGGEIFIHGNGAGSDWTWGCVALEDKDMRELYALAGIGTEVLIHP